MKQSIEPSFESVEMASRNVEVLSERLNHLLSFVPDDKLSWTPSPAAKSCIRITAHCAMVSRFFADVIKGDALARMPPPAEFFACLHADEEKIATREGAVSAVNEASVDLRNAIQSVNATSIDSTPNSPFGPMPMRFWLDECVEHLAKHVGQVEYLQTIWGDLDNHFVLSSSPRNRNSALLGQLVQSNIGPVEPTTWPCSECRTSHSIRVSELASLR